MAADGAASVDAGTVAERVRMAQSVAVSNERYTAKIPFNLVTVAVDRAATVGHKRGIYSIVLSSVGVEGGAESLELFKSYSDLVPLSTQAKTVPQLKGMLLPAAGWFETTDDRAVMTKRMMAIQSFLQATLVAVTTVPGSEVPLKIIKTLCGDSFPATA